MLRTRSRRLAALLVPIVLLALAAYVLWLAYGVNRDLGTAVDHAEQLQQAVADGDDAAARAALEDLQERSRAAADATDGPIWAAVGLLPWIGDDADGVALVSSVVADLSRDGLPALVGAAGDLDALLPRGGRIPIDPIRDLQQPLATGQAAFVAADRQLEAADSSGYIDELRMKYRELADRVSRAAGSLTAAETAVRLLPGMLGALGPREYLLAFQNNAEVRPTGGLPGAVALLEADAGRIEMTRRVAGNSFGRAPAPVLPLTEEEQELYGHHLGTYFLDANFTPDFPRTAALMKARWEQVYDDQVDGVIMLDTVTLAYLLRATGPIEVAGVQLTADNVIEELLHQTYLRFPDPADQDAFFAEVARAVFERFSAGAGSPQGLIEALTRATEEGRIRVHSFHEDEQQLLAGTEVAGALVTESQPAPRVGFYLSDATGSKMSWFLDYDVQIDATYCRGGRQGITGEATLTSEAPPDAAELPDYVTGGGHYGVEPGKQSVAVRIYGPVGGEITKVMLRSKPLEAFVVEHEGRPVAQMWVELAPGQTVDVSWAMTTGEDQTGDPVLTVTPPASPGSDSRTVASACS